MNLNCFADKVQKNLERELGDGYRIILQDVEKNNGIILKGMTFVSKDSNVSPTIYLESFWKDYEEGTTFTDVLSHIKQLCIRETPVMNLDLSFFKRYETVKDRICLRLVNAASNVKMLEKVPHIRFLDLAICFYCNYSNELLGNGTILIRNSHMELWEVSVNTLLEQAKINTIKLNPIQCVPMMEILGEMIGVDTAPKEEDDSYIPMLVVSNDKRSFGAAAMVFQDFWEKMSVRLGKGFYILPSSIHELIILPDDTGVDPDYLKDMICEVNATQVGPEDKLSDSLYFFDAVKKMVRIV